MRARRVDVAALVVEVEIRLERLRQDLLVRDGTFPFNCSDAGVPSAVKLAILVEEIGEVAKEIYEMQSGYIRYERLRVELVQVAAVAVAWLESLQTKPEVGCGA